MKFSVIIPAACILFIVLLSAGCTSSPPQVPETTAPSTPAPTATPAPVASAFPDALSLGQYASFGSGDMQGNATVVRAEIRPNFSWSSPSFNSVAEQHSATLPNGTELGYNLQTPKAGDEFLFVYIRMLNTGPKAVYAPSPMQFVVHANGMQYNYTSVHGPDVVIDGVSEGQYDYQIGPGGVVGYIQPGASNGVNGYLIYEVPASITPGDAYLVVSLDFQHQAVWKLG